MRPEAAPKKETEVEGNDRVGPPNTAAKRRKSAEEERKRERNGLALVLPEREHISWRLGIQYIDGESEKNSE